MPVGPATSLCRSRPPCRSVLGRARRVTVARRVAVLASLCGPPRRAAARSCPLSRSRSRVSRGRCVLVPASPRCRAGRACRAAARSCGRTAVPALAKAVPLCSRVDPSELFRSTSLCAEHIHAALAVARRPRLHRSDAHMCSSKRGCWGGKAIEGGAYMRSEQRGPDSDKKSPALMRGGASGWWLCAFRASASGVVAERGSASRMAGNPRAQSESSPGESLSRSGRALGRWCLYALRAKGAGWVGAERRQGVAYAE